jgi:PIN domain nuclease of toxin-antitoxin system
LILIDTHVWIWLLGDDPQLGTVARRSIEDAGTNTAVAVSAITPWEIALLCTKGRLQLGIDVDQWIRDALDRPWIKLLPLEPGIAVNSVRLPGKFHADPADRFIVATARHHEIPVVTADRAILAYGAEGHVQTIEAAL